MNTRAHTHTPLPQSEEPAVRQCVLKCADLFGWFAPYLLGRLDKYLSVWLQRHVLGGGESGRGRRDGRGELTAEGTAVGEEGAGPRSRYGRPGPRLGSVVHERTGSRQDCESEMPTVA